MLLLAENKMWQSSLNIFVLLLLFFFISSTHSLPITATSRAQRLSQVTEYLLKLGYLPEVEEGNSIDFQPLIPSAVEDFQDMAGLSKTGVLDEQTINVMNKPRCGVKDAKPVQRSKRFTDAESKWHTNLLRWGVSAYSSHLSRTQVLDVLRQAFQVWTSVTNLYFEYKTSGPVDIEVKFVSGSHYDGYRFDGSGGILAHAFFPPQNTSSGSIAGDVHFDDGEPWAVNIHSTGQNLFAVAVHEIGHSLGLQHSNVQGSIMWPWTKDMVTNHNVSQVSLHQDDVQAIEKLYGVKRRRFQREENAHFLCQQNVDAIFRAVNRNIYMFDGATVYQLNQSTLRPMTDSPLPIHDVFPGLPYNINSIDAAVSYKGIWPYEKSYLFVGDQYYRYSATGQLLTNDPGYPKSVSMGWALDQPSFDSVFKFKNSNTLIFLKGQQYWAHTGSNVGAYPSYPKPLSNNTIFQQLNYINAALLHPNNTNYFFDGTEVKRLENDVLHSLC